MQSKKTPIFTVVNQPFDHTPLALSLIQTYALKNTVSRGFYFLPFLSMTNDQILKVAEAFGPGIWLFSNYIWTVDRSLQISAAVKSLNTNNITIHGGPSTPKYLQQNRHFLNKHRHVDYTINGEGEVSCLELLDTLVSIDLDHNSLDKFKQIDGIAFLDKKFNHHIGPDRARIMDLNTIPSPYLSGLFDQKDNNYRAAVIETNRGCPYQCTFCDWGSLTQQKIHQFELDRVYAEVEWLGKNKVPICWIADANFGIFDRDVDITQKIGEVRKKYGYPNEVVVGGHAKNATERIAEIVKIFHSYGITHQGVVAIQTTDSNTLSVIRRSNIKTSKYDELVEAFRKQKLPFSTDLILGLPGATVESFVTDLQYFFDLDIPAKANRLVILPNSPMADPDYINEYKIEFDDNKNVVSTYSYSHEELRLMVAINSLYCLFYRYSFLKYVLRYLQDNHSIKAISFIRNLAEKLRAGELTMNSISLDKGWDSSFNNLPYTVFNGRWDLFYDEIEKFILLEYQLQDEHLADVIKFNKNTMPRTGVEYPIKIELKFDFVSYYKDVISGNPPQSLDQYSDNSYTIDDPFNLSKLRSGKSPQYDSHQVYWELQNPLNPDPPPPALMNAS